MILSDIREEPLWFASILAKRALSAMTLYKIWPFGPRDGTSIIPASTPNEGVIDYYYGSRLKTRIRFLHYHRGFDEMGDVEVESSD